ncbi:hypothetical protein ACFQ4A_11885 [Lentibacillus salinarum]|uniref:Uncharacterized protein n=1 Tax=Lentibacillus salinarum TaxID=446820 RepID=A0ABW3ZVC4_9BACI
MSSLNDLIILHFAKEAGAKFSGCLCGRAIWKDGVQPTKETATPWSEFVE